MSLKHALLAQLSRKPKTGYDLSKDIEGSVGFFWSATHQQIYKDLAELEKRGWVSHKAVMQADKPDKKIFSTTKTGLSELKRWIRESTENSLNKDAFLIKLFVGDLVKPEEILQDLLQRKKSHLDKQKAYKKIEQQFFQNVEDLPLKSQFQYLTLRRGIVFEAGWLSWCKEVEAFLKKRQ